MEILDIQNPHKHSRRWIFRVLGVGAVAGAGWWTWHRGVLLSDRAEPYDPWKNWNTERDPQMRLVSAAVLAASKNNAQPWQFRVEPGFIDVFVDPERDLGAIDPLRQMTFVSAGCALTNLLTAAPVEGFAPTVTWFPDKDSENWVAKVDLAPAAKSTTPLYKAIPTRHTNRAEFDPLYEIPESFFIQTAGDVNKDSEGAVKLVWLDKPDTKKRFADLAAKATDAVMADAEQRQANEKWYRTQWEDVQRTADGMTMDASGLPIRDRITKKLFSNPTPEQVDLEWAARTRGVQIATAHSFGLLTVADPKDRLQAVKAGMAWQKLHLNGTLQNVAMQPLTAVIERAQKELAAGGPDTPFTTALRELGQGAGEPIFAFRIGHARDAALPSPRRSVANVIYQQSPPPEPPPAPKSKAT